MKWQRGTETLQPVSAPWPTTAEKSKEIVDAFVRRRSSPSVEQGRIINEELKRDVKKTVSQAEDTVKRHVEIAVDSDVPGRRAFWSNWSR